VSPLSYMPDTELASETPSIRGTGTSVIFLRSMQGSKPCCST